MTGYISHAAAQSQPPPKTSSGSADGALIITALLIYFLPAIIGRKHHNARAIFIMNLFLGWTFLGWVVALIWACSKPPPAKA